MRVISGKYKKHKLSTLKNSVGLRATSDKVKEAVFNIIGEKIYGSVFLDLFAGSGAIGIEALSRGAKSVFFVENSKTNIKILKENLYKLNIDKNNYKLFFYNVYKFLQEFGGSFTFDFLFFDPPYNKNHIKKTISFLKDFKGVSKDSLIIAETSIKEDFNYTEIENFRIVKKKKYGDTILNIIRKK